MPLQLPGSLWPVLVRAVGGAPHFAFSLAVTTMLLLHVPGQLILRLVLKGAQGAF